MRKKIFIAWPTVKVEVANIPFADRRPGDVGNVSVRTSPIHCRELTIHGIYFRDVAQERCGPADRLTRCRVPGGDDHLLLRISIYYNQNTPTYETSPLL